ncbi:MAG: tRNA lysidine(34) synthetase TilS, partial [Patescibacteria group bacterium]|nr:tRNA lysidine(34) synthetase TilS [Patescibacteria group bacterium]
VHIAKKTGIMFVVAHVNYGLRGEDSIKDQILVEKYAKKNNILCETLVCDDVSSGNENTWRNVRYDFFVQMMQKHAATAIAVAHTTNDQAETVLAHLLRGSGLQGLSGMSVCSVNRVIRPLLFIGREDVLSYCAENKVQYNIDKSNADNSFNRNKIRNELIPYIEQNFNENIVNVLADTARIIGDDYAFLQKQNIVFWKNNSQKNSITFSAKKFLSKHPSVQRMALRAMIEELNNTLVDVESGFVEEMQKAIVSTKNKHQEVSRKNLKMLRKSDIVELTCLSSTN